MTPNPSETALRDGLLPSDRPEMERILHECKFFRPDEITVAVELMEAGLAKGQNSEYHFILAVRGEKVAGYCCYGRIACTVHSYDIYWIVVDPSMRRAGIGKKLLAAAEQRVIEAGGRRIYVDTSSRAHYEPTRKFYISRGYKEEAVLPQFYAPDDDKVVMLKVLS